MLGEGHGEASSGVSRSEVAILALGNALAAKHLLDTHPAQRLPDDIDQRLGEETATEGTTRSEVARAAIAEYLAKAEKERFMAEVIAAARALAADPAAMAESRELAEDMADDGLDPIIEAERSAGHEPGNKWWR